MKKISSLPTLKTKSDFVLIFALVVLGLSPWTDLFWYFIPVATSIVLQSKIAWVRIVPLVSATGILASPFFLHFSLTDLDLLSVVLFFSMGLVLYGCRLEKKSFLSVWAFPPLIAFGGALLAMLSSALADAHWTYSSWAEAQIQSSVFPETMRMSNEALDSLQKSVWTEALQLSHFVFGPLYKSSLIGLFAGFMAVTFPINGMMENLLRSVQAGNLRGQARVFDRFSRWRAPDRLLIPIALGLAMVVFHQLKPGAEALYIQIIGATVLALCLSAIHIHGMALASYLIPRLSFISSLFWLFMVLISPIGFLVLAGLADLWFDLRSKWDTPTSTS